MRGLFDYVFHVLTDLLHCKKKGLFLLKNLDSNYFDMILGYGFETENYREVYNALVPKVITSEVLKTREVQILHRSELTTLSPELIQEKFVTTIPFLKQQTPISHLILFTDQKPNWHGPSVAVLETISRRAAEVIHQTGCDLELQELSYTDRMTNTYNYSVTTIFTSKEREETDDFEGIPVYAGFEKLVDSVRNRHIDGIIVALLIKLDSPGPILYRQKQVGLQGKTFTLYKFRSMYQEPSHDQKTVFTTKNDPRVSRVGKLIRRVRLDETPQLMNILKGDMNLVGPRPEQPEFVEKLRSLLPYYDLRHTIRPGLTGWAQVRYQYADSFEDSHQKLHYDLYYVKHRSWFLDFQIILLTIWSVLLCKGQ